MGFNGIFTAFNIFFIVEMDFRIKFHLQIFHCLFFVFREAKRCEIDSKTL